MRTVPKIKQYRVCIIKRKSGVSSGYLNLPQEFLRELQRRGVDSLLVLYDSILGAFPDTGPDTERALLAFFQSLGCQFGVPSSLRRFKRAVKNRRVECTYT